MSHDGLPARAVTGARAARADRGASATDRRSLLRHALPAALTGAAVIVFAACGSGTTGSSATTGASSITTSSAEASTAASTEASSSAAASSGTASGVLAIVFQPLNGSQILGGAVITDQQDGSSANVQIGIGSTGATDGMPAVLQQGACATAGASGAPGASGSPSESGAPSESSGAAASVPASAAPSVAASAASGGSAAPSGSGEAESAAPSAVTGPPYQLTPLTGGASATLVATTVSALTSEPYSVVLGTSATDPTPAACADVVPGAGRPTTSPAAGASSGASTEPSMGTEPSPSSS